MREHFARSLLEIDLGRLKANVKAIGCFVSSRLPPKILAAVKANAYGHGIAPVAKACVDAGIDYLGVSSVCEGVALRKSGISAPILAMGAMFHVEHSVCLENELVSAVFNTESAEILSVLAVKMGKVAKVHVKIDSGMGRLGFRNGVDEVIKIARLPNIEIEGIFSHFAASESNADYSKEQFERFMDTVLSAKKAGLEIPLKHICNSGGVLNYPEYHLDMVRCGMLVYGLAPCSTPNGSAELAKLGILPILSLKSRVSQIKTVPKGESVGYARNFIAGHDMKVATIPLGYGDGISRALSNKGKVLIGGRLCDVVGNVCMDQLMVDVTGVQVRLEDEVVFIGSQVGRQGSSESISAEDISAWQGTINYEVVTGLSNRLVRYYE